MAIAVADTHTVIWYVLSNPRLSARARATIDDAATAGDVVLFSTITLIEIVYLEEKGRLQPSTLTRILAACAANDAVLIETPVDQQVAQALRLVDRTEVPDMPDRIIAATAVAAGVPLISRDRRIRSSSIATIW